MNAWSIACRSAYIIDDGWVGTCTEQRFQCLDVAQFCCNMERCVAILKEKQSVRFSNKQLPIVALS